MKEFADCSFRFQVERHATLRWWTTDCVGFSVHDFVIQIVEIGLHNEWFVHSLKPFPPKNLLESSSNIIAMEMRIVGQIFLYVSHD